MTILFMICAAVGGTILVCQAILMLMGLGGDDLHTDVPHDIGHDFGGAADAAHGHGGDFHSDASSHGHGQHDQSHEHSSTWFFKVISFRTVTAALTFFGLTGMACQSSGMSTPMTLLWAVGAGLVAMYAVFWAMQTLYTLKSEGTAHIEGAIGLPATVYLGIPGGNGGQGKIQINLQNRTMEYLALTPGDPLPTGSKVVVIGVLGPDTVEVRPVSE